MELLTLAFRSEPKVERRKDEIEPSFAISNSIVASLLLIAATLWLSGCGGSGGSKAANVATSNYCTQGPDYLYVAQFNACYPINGCGAQPNFANVNGVCYPGTTTGPTTIGGGGGNRTWYGQLNITNSSALKSLAKGLRLCDTNAFINYGDNDCGSWNDYAYVQFNTSASAIPAQGQFATVTITFLSSYSGNYYVIPFSGTASLANVSTAFVLQGQVSGTLKTLRIEGPVISFANGNVPIGQVRLTLAYDNAQIGTSDVYLRY